MFFLFHNFFRFSKRAPKQDTPESCFIDIAPIANVDLSNCNYQTISSFDNRNDIRYRTLNGSDHEKQFNMWDNQLFNVLQFQDQVTTLGSKLAKLSKLPHKCRPQNCQYQ